MKVYQILYYDEYYPTSVVNMEIYKDRDTIRAAFSSLKLERPFGNEPYELYESESECEIACGSYFIQEFDLV